MKFFVAGLLGNPGNVSGKKWPTVNLIGTSMSGLVHAIPIVAKATGAAVTVVGGLAVICRLSTAHRATSDLDSVNRRAAADTSHLELLVASGATRRGPCGVEVDTEIGSVAVDILEVTDEQLADLPDDPTGRLHLLAHAWAADTATPVVLNADGMPDIAVAVAEPGPLIAMKLQSVMDRGADKEATDLLDIVRLALDRTTREPALAQLDSAAGQLRHDAALHAERWFVDHRERSMRLVRKVPEAADIVMDDLTLVGDLLLDVLR